MGLKIGYRYTARVSAPRARRMVEELHAFALRIPFDEISDVEEVTRFGPLPATDHPIHDLPNGERVTLDIPPIRGWFFSTYVDGSENATFGLASRPATISAKGRRIRTGLAGVHTWLDCPKTQYAGMPDCGGPDNFLRAHLSIVAVLDHAASLGAEVDVHDDGDYWEHRDEQLLLDRLDGWNRYIAGFGAWLIENVPGEAPVGPIFDHPDYDRLAAEGKRELERAQRKAQRRMKPKR